jgi:hypothetical protein
VNLKYFFPRLVRHFMPEALARFLLKHRWIIRPGLESSDPASAVEQYIAGLSAYGISIQGKRILLFGYGGRFAVGAELLRRGAAHVVLCDHFVLLDRERNLELLPAYADFLELENGDVKPRPEFITLLHGDIRDASLQGQIARVDCVLSTSVYEHLDDVEGITRALAKLTSPQGAHLHFIDLRDHYFKFPFEMLTFPESVWKKFLNPTSNLNRLRYNDYAKVFNTFFAVSDVVVLQRDLAEFQKARARIRPEFLTGNEEIDAVMLLRVFSKPSR